VNGEDAWDDDILSSGGEGGRRNERTNEQINKVELSLLEVQHNHVVSEF